MKANNRFLILLLVLAALAGGFIWGLATGVYHLPPYDLLNRAKDVVLPGATTPTPVPTQQPTQAYTGLKDIVALIQDNPELTSVTSRIDFAREFVYANSIHKIDDDSSEYAYDTARVLQMLYDTYQGGKNPPHLVCDTRTYALDKILRKLKLNTRVVMIFSDEGDSVGNSHTFLEVFNPDTQAWEVQDPDYNVVYVDQRNQQRVSATDLLMYDLSSITPVSSSPEMAESARKTLMPKYFEAMVVLARGQDSFALINTSRYEVSKVQTFLPGENENYDEFRAYVKEHLGDFPVVPLEGSPAYPDTP